MVAGDPGRAAAVEHVGPVPQPQHEPAVVARGPHPQRGVLCQIAAGAGRVEDGLEQRSGQAQLAPETVDREVLVRQELRLDSMGVRQQRPPRVGFGRQPAGQRSAALHGDVAGDGLALAGQHGEHLGVRGQEHRAQRHRQLVGQPAQRRREVVADRRLVLGHARHRIEGPPRDRGEPAGDEHPAPELAAGLPWQPHQVVPPLTVATSPTGHRSPRVSRLLAATDAAWGFPDSTTLWYARLA